MPERERKPVSGGEWVEVARFAELPPGKIQRVEAAGRVLAVVRLDAKVHALDAVCPHQGGPLDKGTICEGKLECPWHHFVYDLATGANIYPAGVYPSDMPQLAAQIRPLTLFPVRVDDDRVWVWIERRPASW